MKSVAEDESKVTKIQVEVNVVKTKNSFSPLNNVLKVMDHSVAVVAQRLLPN